MIDKKGRFAATAMRMNGVPDFEMPSECRARQEKLRRQLGKVGAVKLATLLGKCRPTRVAFSDAELAAGSPAGPTGPKPYHSLRV